jgi:hypothetical protein
MLRGSPQLLRHRRVSVSVNVDVIDIDLARPQHAVALKSYGLRHDSGGRAATTKTALSSLTCNNPCSMVKLS